MEIISVSLDRDTLRELEDAGERLGFRSRSRLVRAGIQKVVEEHKVIEKLRGENNVVFVVTYKERKEDELGGLMKNFEDIIATEIHQHHIGKCLRILIASGDAERIKELFKKLKSERSISALNCTIL